MTVRDLTPEQRRELLAAWDAAVRLRGASALARWFDLAYSAFGTEFIVSGPHSVAFGL